MPAATLEAPVFEDAGHALHVAFLIHSLPPNVKSPTALLIDALVKKNHTWDEQPAARTAMVNFSGLSPMEVRAQAAQVVAMVEHLPHAGEVAACKAVYGYQQVKADGVRALAGYVEPVLSQGSEATAKDYALYVAWLCFMSKAQREEVGPQDVAKRFGTTAQQVSADCAVVRRYASALQRRALTQLQARFEDGGLVLRTVDW